MAAFKAPAAALHDLPSSVDFTLADGTRLTAAVRISARARRARLSLLPRGGLVLAIPQSMGPEQLKASLPLFVPWLERAQRNQLRALPAPQLPAAINLPLIDETFTVTCAGDMALGRKAAAACKARAGTLQISRGVRRVLLVESAGLLRLFGSVDDIPLCALALRQWARKKATLLLPPHLEHLASTAGFALAGVSVRDQRGRWGSCSRLRPQRAAVPGRGKRAADRISVLDQISTRVRNFFSPPGGQPNGAESSAHQAHAARNAVGPHQPELARPAAAAATSGTLVLARAVPPAAHEPFGGIQGRACPLFAPLAKAGESPQRRMAWPALVGLARRRPSARLSRSRGIASHKKTASSAITEKAAALYLPAHT